MMTNFEKWLQYTGLSIAQAAELLGFHRNRITAFKNGHTTAPQNKPAFPDRRTRYAMAAIAEKLPEWPDDPRNISPQGEDITGFTVDNTTNTQE